MSQTIEMHIIQSYPANRTNRGEDGAPKTIYFGQDVRSRISSQAQKRAERSNPHYTPETISVRTKNPEKLVKEYIGHYSTDLLALEYSDSIIRDALSGIFGAYDDKGRLKTQVFIGSDEAERIAEEIQANLTEASAIEDQKERTAFAKSILGKFKSGTGSLDIALYGRMLAETKGWNINAATSYSHAFSIHRAYNESDFFSAIDDLDEVNASGHIGNHDMMAATMYRMAALDLNMLRNNLGDGADLYKATKLWAERACLSVPMGGSHGTYAHTVPDYILFVVRNDGHPLNLAPAFEIAVRRQRDLDPSMVVMGAKRLEEYFSTIQTLYGNCGNVHARSLSIHKFQSDYGLEREHDLQDSIKNSLKALEV